MDELFLRFPHLSESIFLKLDDQSLATCRKVSRTWNEATKVKRNLWLKVINGYTAGTYLQPHYGNGVFGNVYLSAEQH